METDTSYLTEQVANIIAQLHGLFDEIGVPRNERDARESELFAALSETLDHQLKSVSNEKHDLHATAKRLATTVKQLQASLDDRDPRTQSPRVNDSDPDLQITYPLRECLTRLEEKHHNMERLHQERLDQVNKLVTALTSYSSHLDPSLLTIPLPPSPCPATFSLSPTYISQLDNAFTSIYEVYQSRVAHVRSLATELINLWAELGTPSAQTEQRIVECAESYPEQLGLREADIKRLQATRDRFANEKAGRERKVAEVGGQIRGLWERLGVEKQYRTQFERRNRGVGMKVLNEYEEELRRLLELKRQNLGVFVEEARLRLQELWDELFFSEEEMLVFTPAFSDVHTDALLSSHESEIARLTAIQSERAPILALVSRHRNLLEDRASLAASSQDASRLMNRGQKGEKRDPGKLLREEKMRKRIQKELPKLEAELRNKLMDWEAEYGRDFLVWGDRYLDELEDGAVAEAAKKQPTRSKTPVAPAPAMKNPKFSASTSKPQHGTVRGAPPRSKTPTPYTTTSSTTNGTIRPAHHTRSKTAGSISPSKIPARAPLHPAAGNTISPTRIPYKPSGHSSATLGRQPAPPPRMDLSSFLPPRAETPVTSSSGSPHLGSVVRAVPPEDVYEDSGSRQTRLRLQHLQGGSANASAYGQTHADLRAPSSQGGMYSRPPSAAASMRSVESGLSASQSHSGGNGAQANWYPMAPPPPPSSSMSSYGASSHGMSSGAPSRQISAGSSQSTQSGVISGSENWETYSEESGSEIGGSQGERGAYEVRGYDARGYQLPMQEYMAKHGSGHGARVGHAGTVRGVDNEVETEWTDEDGF
ncbi:hypothetical protein P152DRAFT_455498 [Eremomyces bilateralis CBS 781.70]|uniref:Microtubule associated protein n=1 Tax=Eremomyces bilateralis CBS 781.70 TaxID=1392243 RepID=A0A6G1GCM0_9PEZI|nr:uncharacterized protein P152DRAFT_455498 [Eremomyces bilateralis CBS 781.70]KAF1815783.1 hypothetical protein P152DRAFT_455498 [Eremomyces bilateralis CBS 781.70]